MQTQEDGEHGADDGDPIGDIEIVQIRTWIQQYRKSPQEDTTHQSQQGENEVVSHCLLVSRAEAKMQKHKEDPKNQADTRSDDHG